MKSVFKIGEVVWTISGWGKVVDINRSTTYSEYACCDRFEDLIGVELESGERKEYAPSSVWQIAQDRFYKEESVVWEHDDEIDYPFYCPALDENCYYCELD